MIDYLVSKGISAVVVSGIGPTAFERLRGRGTRVYLVPKSPAGALTPEEAAEMLVMGN